ncbi:MAG TPA: GGDEF domain-containing protein [Acidobacteriaceae bacterium]|nr:GGDEF domain-containing protein [Acidobacteriaceae bacterium]
MISIKKYLDGGLATPDANEESDPAKVLPVAIESWRGSLRAMGRSAAKASVLPEGELEQDLARLEAMLAEKATVGSVAEVERMTQAKLEAWAERTAEHLKQQMGGVKELLLLLAGTAASVGERDRRYSKRFEDLTTELQAVAKLHDLVQIQTTLKKKAVDLKQCVAQMTEEGQQSMTKLRDKVTVYETRLEEAEQLVMKDGLTGVANRRAAEARMERCIGKQQKYCAVMLDLNRFKQVNDTYGHAAGDDLLKKFADELKKNMRMTDLVARWGGDEFVVVLSCDMAAAEPQVERMRKWVLGKYTIDVGAGKTMAVEVGASVGVAEWALGMTPQQVIEAADKAMYGDKQLSRKRGA